MTTRPPYVGSIVRNVFVLSVGFGLGMSCAMTGGSVPDLVDQSVEEARTENASTVSAATWKDGPWPFTVDRGELVCIGPLDDPGVFIVTDAGDMFALNPAAILMADRVGAEADLDPIWRWRDPELMNAKVNVSPMILYALKRC